MKKNLTATAALFTVAALAATCKPGKPTKANGKAAPKTEGAADTQAPAESEKEEPAPKTPKLKFEKRVVKVADLVLSAKFQPRAAIDKEAVNDYAEVYKSAKEKGADSPLPLVKAIERNGELIVFSGFHRTGALRKAELEDTIIEVAKNDAITDGEIFRLGIDANEKNGVRLTGADKLHNLLKIIKFPEFANLSNNALTSVVGASEFFIRRHRPASASPSVRTSKSGKKVNTKGIGKKGGSTKVSKKAEKAAAALAGNQSTSAENASLDAALAGVGAGTPPATPKLDADSERAVERICKILDGKNGFTAQGVRDGIEQGTISLSPSDLKEFANNSDSRVEQIAPLVINRGLSPKKANKEIDQVVDSSSKVSGLINLAIAEGGVTRRAHGSRVIGHKVEDNSDFVVVVYDARKFDVVLHELTK